MRHVIVVDKHASGKNPPSQESTASYLQELSAVLEKAQQGDSRAENTLHQEFVNKLVRVASKRINERFQAKIAPEEIVQSVFASFFRRHRNQEFQFDGWNDLWALLLKITVRKCADRIGQFRTLKRDVTREIGKNANTDSDPTWLVPTSEPTAQEVLIFEETLDRLFDRLSEIQRKIVLMKLQGMSNLEISQLIGRTERTVYRMLNQIKEQLLEMDPGFSGPAVT